MTAKRQRSTTQAALQRLNDTRVAAGVCRHCGGRVPCWSPSGDWAVGLAYPKPRLRVRAPGIRTGRTRR